MSDSGLFDAQWYLAQYPDIAAASLDPLDHFLDHGGLEGRSPGPQFDTVWYLDAYPDARKSGLNPLVHFILHGKGRALSLEDLPSPSDQEAHDIQELLDTPLFDAKWYAKTYKINAEPLLAARHYIRAGGHKGLSPSRAFDGAQYLKANPDVLDGGIVPLLHYLRHGKSEGRLAYRHSVNSSHAPTLYFDERASWIQDEHHESTWTPASQFAESEHDTLYLGGIAVALVSQDAHPEPETLRSCVLFARLMQLPVDGFAKIGRRRFAITGDFTDELGLSDLDAHIHDGWFSSDHLLTLRVSPQAADGIVVRALQITSPQTGLLAEAFVGTTGALLRIQLANPLFPLLLVVTSVDGLYRSSQLVPFPSLFRGGLHYGESEALGRGGASGDRRRTYSLRTLRNLLGWQSAPELSLRRVEVDASQATGNEPIFSNDVKQWLSHVGIEVAPIETAALHDGVVHCARAVALSPLRRRFSGGILTIKADSFPSLLAISSRRLSDGAGAFVLTEGPGAPIPRLFVRPASSPTFDEAGFPAFRGTGDPQGRRSGLLAAVRYLPKNPPGLATLAYPVAMGSSRTRKTDCASVSVVLSGKKGADFKRSLEALRRQTIAGDMRIVICGDVADDFDWISAGANVLAPRKDGHSTAATLNTAATCDDHSWLLFVDAGVVAHDPRTLETLIDIARTSRVATASCMRLCETGFNGGQAVTVKSAGLFPSHIDFSGSPALTFDAPDVSTALGRSTYRVAANGLEFMLVSQEAWREMKGFDVDAQPFEGFALDFQLRALAHGWANVCTTMVSVLDLNRDRQERSDVVSSEALAPREWGDLLERVTTVRRLD